MAPSWCRIGDGAHPHDQTRNFIVPILNDDGLHSGHQSVDRAQWSSGVPLCKSILTNVFLGLNLGPERLAVIRHATAFDDQLARACIHINQDTNNAYLYTLL